MDQVTASVETIHEGQLCVLTTHYLSDCGCEWVVDMWGNVRRVKICPRDTNDIRWENQNQLTLFPTGLPWDGPSTQDRHDRQPAAQKIDL